MKILSTSLRRVRTWSVALLLTTSGALAVTAYAPKSTSATALRSRAFRFEYQATVRDIPTGAKQVDLWLPVPHSDKSQNINDLQVDSPYPYEVVTSQYGNHILHLNLLNPKEIAFTVTMHFDALRREHINPTLVPTASRKAPTEPADPDMQRWLQPDKLVPLDNQIKTWATEVVAKANAKTDLEKARAIYEHVVSTVKYDKSGQGWGRGDIYYACDARRGNCTDFHAVFIGYCRAVGIPARFSIGFPLPADRGEGQVQGYHCWAEFYTKETGWVPVDASEAAKDPSRRTYFFGAHDENRVEFTRGRDLALAPPQHNGPLNFFIYPYAEVDGKPFTSIDKKFSYHDAAPAPASK
ncbi:transglutaminase-like domain-containing protein [Hymenobacter jejuensis]|uniref:transglutaminase-like domain-containing protein n=1 Tax=Hymenobacter jejuensis TaxID=2502781 RepID=UPI001E35B60E|nr:transglutaminase domain-containing protein [Hymenobacter jejuensis]